MIIKVNEKGVFIDVSMSASLTNQFGTSMATIPSSFIAKLTIHHPNLVDEMVKITDKFSDEYQTHYSIITSINGVSGFTSNQDVFNAINDALFNFNI